MKSGRVHESARTGFDLFEKVDGMVVDDGKPSYGPR